MVIKFVEQDVKLDVSANQDSIEMIMASVLVGILVLIHTANRTRLIKNVVIAVWNQRVLSLILVIVFVIHHVIPDVNVTKDLCEINMEIASNPNSAQILIVHIMKCIQAVLINVKKKIVIPDRVGIQIQFVKLGAFVKKELFGIRLLVNVLKPVNVGNVLV